MVSNNGQGLHHVEPGAINQHTQSLRNVKPGTLCWVGEEEWCMCIVPGPRRDGQPNRVMIGSDKANPHYVIPVSSVVSSDELGPIVWCIVSGLGIVQMGAGAHVRMLNVSTTSV